ncbi:DNA topoisomerase 1-like protein [Dinothrombium tinctorium]|uniref:DNA topoisomerase I n=1 Tax=Dinothrombium tinctorium TaxID=1965070 RepID=A0A3S3Q5Z8_9ACAR|nr:DNA topoisomerase 1-like protein [Dinothrombium tinctorium]RWS14575.1 DNA topoisomerase 1-like protein [Dinothrombium tinctorium]
MGNYGENSSNSIQTASSYGDENTTIKREFESPSDQDTNGYEQSQDVKDSGYTESAQDSESESESSSSSSESESENESEKSVKNESSEESEEDKPLTKLKESAKSKRSSSAPNYKEEESDEDIPLSKKKKPTKTPNTKKRKSESDEEYSVKKTKTSSVKKRKKQESSDEYDESDYDTKKKKTTKKKSEDSSKKAKSEKNKEVEKSPTKGKKKKEEDEQHIWKWWLEDNSDPSQKWRTLIHKGPVFAPPYEPLPSHVKFYYDGKPVKLSLEAEEVASFYAKMLDHDYTSRDVFNKNFFKDWRKHYMTDKERELITDLKKCDFREMHQYFKEESEKRKQMTKEEKAERKKKDEAIQQEYGYCIVDGHKQKIGNYKIEPPGLFRGRGEHPKMGKVKRRIQPEDVIINIGKKSDAPPPPSGHKWKEVRVDKSVTWLASWTENIMGNVKYIMLNPSSKLKSMKDWQKYEKARELKKYVDQIRKDYREDFKAREMVKRQRAVALYFIDTLALRAGNEKEEGETADTVGCCSLRVEHITLHEEKDGQQYVVEFDFLGKDSIRYQNSVPVEKRVFKNLRLFMENKSPSDDLFDRLTTATLNKYLNSLMEGLTAKVFRTYNASITLQDQLQKLTRADMSLPEKILAYNRANRAVAVLCNHQRSIPKTFDKQMDNLNNKIGDKKEQISAVKKELKKAKKGNDTKESEKLKKRLKTLEEQLKKLEVQLVDKDENKQIALGTSKLNYLDPRISVAWWVYRVCLLFHAQVYLLKIRCKKFDVPIERVYNKTQRDKFRWAIEMVGADYIF